MGPGLQTDSSQNGAMHRHRIDGVLVITRQEDDPVPTLDDRVGSQGGRDQVIEAFHELSASERLRNEGGGWEAVQFLHGN